VRYADEIVDTFHEHDKARLIAEFRKETQVAIAQKISLNPVLHAFQLVVNQYNIDYDLIDAFLKSMEMDLDKVEYDQQGYEEYIYGSAEVIGLMCLKVFCDGNSAVYEPLVAYARKLGSAFQKINFLRDIRSDFEERGRVYFPGVDFNTFSEQDKKAIEEDIQADFEEGLKGIRLLPNGCRKGVYIAYVYYFELFKKIKKSSAREVTQKRIRVSDPQKMWLMAQALVKNSWGRI
jgi:phytoene/squalene synthetase